MVLVQFVTYKDINSQEIRLTCNPPWAVIAFVQIHVQRPGIQDVLLAFPAVDGLGLHPYGFQEVQEAFRKEESQEMLVKSELRDGFVHDTCGLYVAKAAIRPLL